MRVQNPAARYGIAVLAVLVAVLARLALAPVVGPSFPFATLFFAVLASAALGGFGPGLVATLLGVVCSAVFLLPPTESLAVERREDQLGLVLFATISLGITLLGAALRRTREQALALAERVAHDGEQLRITLASIGDGVLVTDALGRVTAMNPVAETLTGWPFSEARGLPHRSVFNIVSDATRSPVESPVERVLREGAVTALANHTILVTRDRRDRWIDDSAAPIRGADGEVRGVVLVFREIAERRRGEAAQRQLASIVENSQDAIYGKNLDGTLTSWNAGAERLFGYRASEVLGKPSSLLTPADRLAEQSAILVVDRNPAEPFETVRRRKDGTEVQVSMSLSPVRDAAGAVVGSSTIARDITSQKRVENELRRAEGQLREADRRKDEFLAVLAHELRNPLAPLRNALAILTKAEAGSPVATEARDMAERQVQHLARLVDDLLDVSRITHNRIVLQKERLLLATGVARAVETARPAIEAQQHELVVELPEAPVFIDADPVRFAQMFANLLNNAAQYTAPGGRITLTAEADGGEAQIRVADTGLGIPAEALPHVFDMFTQASPRAVRSPHSLGIGLRLVKGLVEMHDGRVEALSEGPDRGSVFVVRLPLASGPAAPGPAPSSNGAAPRPRKVLVVDDNVDAATSLRTLLELEGHQALVAYSGSAALDLFEREAPDVVFLDIGMPDLDGYEVARRMRGRKRVAPVILIALTGWGQEHDRLRAREAGFDHHLTKPVAPAALFAIVASSPSA